MLALTAIHDIFKVEALLPRVREEHSPFHGFVAGDVINDHDVAMYYVLEHYPEVRIAPPYVYVCICMYCTCRYIYGSTRHSTDSSLAM